MEVLTAESSYLSSCLLSHCICQLFACAKRQALEMSLAVNEVLKQRLCAVYAVGSVLV